MRPWPSAARLLLVALGLAGWVGDCARPPLDLDDPEVLQGVPRGFSAAIYAEPPQSYQPGVKQVFELLRFVTGFRTGLEVLVDVSPFSPLIDAISRTGSVSAYAFIDTWVGRDSGLTTSEYVKIDGGSSSCSLHKEVNVSDGDGNGWSLTAELLLWRQPVDTVDIRPRETITLASGPTGSSYDIGTTRVYEGWSIDGGRAVLLDSPADLGQAADDQVSVYECPAGGMARARQLAVWGEMAALLADKPDADVERLVEQVRSELLADQLVVLQVRSSNLSDGTAECEYGYEGLELQPNMPVFYASGEVHSTSLQGGPKKVVGRVTSVGAHSVAVRLDVPCLPTAGTKLMPHLLVPRSPRWHAEAEVVVRALRQIVEEARRTQELEVSVEVSVANGSNGSAAVVVNGTATSQSVTPVDSNFWHLQGRRLAPLPVAGKVKLPEQPESKASLLQLDTKTVTAAGNGGSISAEALEQHGPRLCVVDERRTGRVLERAFDVSALEEGDRVVMQFLVTGHGWAKTVSRCGEFCHAVYDLSFNGMQRLNITLWRDDCPDNPWGHSQSGTWDQPRNGWCPGSVEAGLFVDVTDYLREGRNSLEIHMQVWSENDQRYEPYHDTAGYESGETASVVVGSTLSVYPAAAVRAIRARRHAYTAAEKALRDGSSGDEALHPAEKVEFDDSDSFLQLGDRPSRQRDPGVESLQRLALQRGVRTPAGVMFASSQQRGRLDLSMDAFIADKPLGVGPDLQAGTPTRPSLLAQGFLRRNYEARSVSSMDKVAKRHSELSLDPREVDPGQSLLFRQSGANRYSKLVEDVPDGTLVEVKRVGPAEALVHFPQGFVANVSYQDLFQTVELQLGGDGAKDNCSALCTSELFDGKTRSCANLVAMYAKVEQVLTLEGVLRAVNRACDGQCRCSVESLQERTARTDTGEHEQASPLADFSTHCKQRVHEEAVPDAWEDSVTQNPVKGSVVDFESAAPWYCYSADGAARHLAGSRDGEDVLRVTLFNRTNIHVWGREQRQLLPRDAIPPDFRWGRAGVRLRLDRPRWPGRRQDGSRYREDFDHWDRLGSIGFLLPGDGPGLALFPADERRRREWPVDPAEAQ